ncbi:hypothetical protein METHPM2_30003 [Pseudomonas sp. PM2]
MLDVLPSLEGIGTQISSGRRRHGSTEITLLVSLRHALAPQLNRKHNDEQTVSDLRVQRRADAWPPKG